MEAKDNIFSYAFIAEPFFLRSMRLFYSNLMIFMFLNTAVKKTVGKKLRASFILPLVVSVILQSIRTDIYTYINACMYMYKRCFYFSFFVNIRSRGHFQM